MIINNNLQFKLSPSSKKNVYVYDEVILQLML